MDSFYPNQAAANAIIEWNEKLCKPDAPLIKLAMAWPAAALDINNGQTAKAMFPTTGTHRQEAVFTIVGALRAKDLPPVKGTKQHATLIGWDAPYFDKALKNMQEVAYTMYSSSAENAVEPWRPETTDDGDALISSNISPLAAISRSTLERLFTRGQTHTASHCVDNDVMYMAFKEEEYVEKDPSTFRTGDIVEMGFAFVAWKKPGRNVGPEWSCMPVLRTLTFLDGRFTKEAHFAREAYKAERSRGAPSKAIESAMNHLPKRRFISGTHSDKEEASASKRMHTLTIRENNHGL
ncbi:hypothetical protein DFH08DRAFT_827959 [Mycena albidolilacea]|uniref:Uncharacterized protein n=1 Tax=Mycena albidolilacea TaxID=1033008 RepID=A0AAD7E6U9_9AGAR|nr:hypothetical protein DFH08DRAFT_827959 [Mycena albidolilacea]